MDIVDNIEVYKFSDISLGMYPVNVNENIYESLVTHELNTF